MTLTAQVGFWLTQAATLPDTIVTKQAGGTGVLGTITTIANILVTIAVIAGVAVLIPAIVAVRKASHRMTTLLDHVGNHLDPLASHATRIADDVQFITTSVRRDVHELERTVERVTGGVNAGLDAAGRRLAELSALLRVAQDELEASVIAAGATLRGVRAGASALRGEYRSEAHHRLEHHDDEELADDDGTDHTRDGTRGPGPRIRHRTAHDPGE